MPEQHVVWDWVSKHAGNVTDRRGEPTTVVWPRDIGTFLGGNRIEARRHLRALKASGLLIAPRPGTHQQYVKVSDGRFAVAYVFACAPEDVPRIETGAGGHREDAGRY